MIPNYTADIPHVSANHTEEDETPVGTALQVIKALEPFLVVGSLGPVFPYKHLPVYSIHHDLLDMTLHIYRLHGATFDMA